MKVKAVPELHGILDESALVAVGESLLSMRVIRRREGFVQYIPKTGWHAGFRTLGLGSTYLHQM